MPRTAKLRTPAEYIIECQANLEAAQVNYEKAAQRLRIALAKIKAAAKAIAEPPKP